MARIDSVSFINPHTGEFWDELRPEYGELSMEDVLGKKLEIYDFFRVMGIPTDQLVVVVMETPDGHLPSTR
jgi:hypothetical protein